MSTSNSSPTTTDKSRNAAARGPAPHSNWSCLLGRRRSGQICNHCQSQITTGSDPTQAQAQAILEKLQQFGWRQEVEEDFQPVRLESGDEAAVSEPRLGVLGGARGGQVAVRGE